MYKLESHLVKELEYNLTRAENPFSQLNLAFEFNYTSGRVDVIGVTSDKQLIAFEAKLSNWRKAVHQAYRNTSFSHYSYVVLPLATAQNALRWGREFERRGVGLCSIDSSGLKIEIPASKLDPLLPWLTNNALEYIKNSYFNLLRGDGCHSNPPCCQQSPMNLQPQEA